MLGPCAICKHDLNGGTFGWAPGRTQPTVWACSLECAALVPKLYGRNDLMTEIEKDARVAAGQVAGQYLDGIGKTDLGELTDEEWQGFLNKLFEAYHSTLVEAAHRHAPF